MLFVTPIIQQNLIVVLVKLVTQEKMIVLVIVLVPVVALVPAVVDVSVNVLVLHQKVTNNI